MRRAERIVIALGPFGEAGQAAAGAQRADAVASAGQDLVRIGLVTDVPDQAVAGRVEHVVDGGGQFDDAETGPEVPTRNRHRVDGLLTQFVGDLPDLFHLEPAQIIRRSDLVEKRRFTECGHSDIPILHVGLKVRRGGGFAHISPTKDEAPGVTCAGPKPVVASLDVPRISQCDLCHSSWLCPSQPFFPVFGRG